MCVEQSKPSDQVRPDFSKQIHHGDGQKIANVDVVERDCITKIYVATRHVAKNIAGGLKKVCKEVLDKEGAATRG